MSEIMYKGEDKIIDFLGKWPSATIESVAKSTGLHIDTVRRIVESLKENGFVEITVEEKEQVNPTQEFVNYAADRITPEFSVFLKAVAKKTITELSNEEKAFGLPWAKKKGYISIEGSMLIPVKTVEEVKRENDVIFSIYEKLGRSGQVTAEEKNMHAVIFDELFSRKWIRKSLLKAVEIIRTGKPYNETPAFDVNIESADAAVGKNHPLTIMTNRIRNIFLELGFQEMDGPLIESAFWNFDALFTPQDHPARELADTFYIPAETDLPDRRLVEKIKKSHEKNWNCKWVENEAKKLVLRTHTTSLSARYLSSIGKKRAKLFAVGKVFRNEATDYKHLAEFHQVEGIISWKNATFCDLLGMLKLFYSKLGFEKIRFRPSFFPYTEPSLEIEVFYEPRKQWMELGGAGIFRPELTLPLADTYPVLAWGLSLERPLMLMLGIEDIRTFYRNDLDFLKKTKL